MGQTIRLCSMFLRGARRLISILPFARRARSQDRAPRKSALRTWPVQVQPARSNLHANLVFLGNVKLKTHHVGCARRVIAEGAIDHIPERRSTGSDSDVPFRKLGTPLEHSVARKYLVNRSPP